jgi:hypothetical protein
MARCAPRIEQVGADLTVGTLQAGWVDQCHERRGCWMRGGGYRISLVVARGRVEQVAALGMIHGPVVPHAEYNSMLRST